MGNSQAELDTIAEDYLRSRLEKKQEIDAKLIAEIQQLAIEGGVSVAFEVIKQAIYKT